MHKTLLYALLFLFISCFSPTEGYAKTPLKVRIFSENNGYGLEADQQILKEAIEYLGHSVEIFYYRSAKYKVFPPADINIFFEKINPKWLKRAQINWFIPNPEWYYQPMKLLPRFDLILCRTKEIERIFNSLQIRTYYLGFTSKDCYVNGIPKDYSTLFHLAGASIQKGTGTILNMWENDSSLPHLILLQYPNAPSSNSKNLSVIAERVSEEDLRFLQNNCAIHLCPSETEGFGHSITEALSAEAVIVTTDAPPMNEFIKDKRCLVPYYRTSQKQLGTNYYVDPTELKNTINNLIKLPESELEAIGKENRTVYLNNKQDFYDRLDLLLQAASIRLSSAH